jgi:hypothetical protein
MLKKLLGIDKLEQENKELLAKLEQENKELQAKLEQENKELQAQISELQAPVKSDKDIATENGKPWIGVLDTKFDDPTSPGKGYFELDYNKLFVEQLIEAGYSGRNDEDVVDMWFNDLCRGVIGD